MNATLKELLKLPFECEKGRIYFDNERYLFVKFMVANILKPPNGFATSVLKELECFTTQALNNEYQRVYGEPKQWGQETCNMFDEDVILNCPNCSEEYRFECALEDIAFARYNYCPSCGVKLDPPEASNG